MTDSVSVIIPTLNEPQLQVCLASLVPQLLSEDEIIVVGQFDFKIKKQFPMIIFLDTQFPVNAATARNIGIRKATKDIFLFVDSDCIPSEKWIERHRELQRKGIAVVGGGVAIHHPNFWTLADNLSMFHDFTSTQKKGKKALLPSCNLSVHRSVWLQVGDMDETLPRGEDSDWTLRMRRHGFSLNFFPHIEVRHSPSRNSWASVYDHWFQSGIHNIKVRRKYREEFRTPKWVNYPIYLKVFSPLIAFWASAKIFSQMRYWQYGFLFPIVYLTKIVYCWGAATKNSN
ncbi:MAG: glycosyltransferase family 2 protein [Deltaproteobacteria bacterium]